MNDKFSLGGRDRPIQIATYTLVTGVPDDFVRDWVSHAIASGVHNPQEYIIDLLEGENVANIVRRVLDECDEDGDEIKKDYEDTLADIQRDVRDGI